MKLLLPPGLGDLHWTLLKMQGLIERVCPGKVPKVFIASNDPNKNRGGDYLDSIPFVEWGGYIDIRRDRASFTSAFTRGTKIHGYTAPSGEKFDLFYSNNHDVERGLRPRDWFPEGGPVDYAYPVQLDLKMCPIPDEPYVLVSLYRHGWYADWWEHEPPMLVIEAIRRALPEHRIILTGAVWDAKLCKAVAEKNRVESWAGKTSLRELLVLIKHAECWIGHAAGNAMLAVHLKTPTVMIWGHPPFSRQMWACWAPPGARHYVPYDVHGGMKLTDAIAKAVHP